MSHNKNYYKQYGNTIVYFLWDKHMRYYFKGTAVCSPEDTFILEKGVRIAKQKALSRMFNWRANLEEERLELIDELIARREDVVKQRDYWREKAEKSFSKLIELNNE